jgi:hypothetical protein
VNRELKIHRIKEMLLRFPDAATPFIETKEQDSLPVEDRLTRARMAHDSRVARTSRPPDR